LAFDWLFYGGATGESKEKLIFDQKKKCLLKSMRNQSQARLRQPKWRATEREISRRLHLPLKTQPNADKWRERTNLAASG
jgi:hypothetical protein